MLTRLVLLTCFATILLCACKHPQHEATALQGLRGNTLVAGKSTAFRLYAEDTVLAAANRIDTTLIRPDGSSLIRTWPKSDFRAIPNSSKGPSIVVLLAGKDLPWVGTYQFAADVYDATGGKLASYLLDPVELLPTKDLIVAIDRVNADAINPGSAAEIQAARDAMTRLGGIWPIRDGISAPDADRTSGLRFVINNNPQPHGCDKANPTNSDCQECPFFATWQNRPVNMDSMNLGIGYRFLDPKESVGGIAPNFCPGQTVGWASIVMSGELAPGFGQESGHVFTLEPSTDPHFDLTVQAGHSKDNTIDPTDVELGYDVQLNQPFPATTFDVMHQAVCGCANSAVSYNSWDWEYLRNQFAKLSSTGPTASAGFVSDVAPASAGVGNSIYFFASRVDGRVYYNRAVLGQAGVGWKEMEGGARTDVSPAAASVGTHLFIAIKQRDGTLASNQADEGASFGEWFPLNFSSDVAPAVAGVGQNVYYFAKSADGHIYFNRAQLGQGGLGWTEIPGEVLTDAAPAAGAIGNHVYVAIKGVDGGLYLNQADLGQPFGQWFPMEMNSRAPPAITGVGDNVYFFVAGDDGRVNFNRAKVGQAGIGWAVIQPDGQTNVSPAAAAVGTHVFVMIRGTDRILYVNQSDLGAPFGEWFP